MKQPTTRPVTSQLSDRNSGPLVSTSISEQNTLELFRNKLKIRRPAPANPNQVICDRTGTTLQGFSDKSKSRLRHAATNATPELISQLALTYHDEWPTDGRICKAQLHYFLVYLKRISPGTKYLWIMEFQTRNAPHFHLFLTTPPNPETWQLLADKWNEITNGTPEQLWFHGPQRGENWITWTMHNGSYLVKYLDKDKQKAIPPGYNNFGRFWGNSRDLVPPPETHNTEHLETLCCVDQETGEIYGGETTVIRWLGRLADKQTNGYSRFRKRAQHGSYSMTKGTPAYRQIEIYFEKLRKN